jgi:hypothetical protein
MTQQMMLAKEAMGHASGLEVAQAMQNTPLTRFFWSLKWMEMVSALWRSGMSWGRMTRPVRNSMTPAYLNGLCAALIFDL